MISSREILGETLEKLQQIPKAQRALAPSGLLMTSAFIATFRWMHWVLQLPTPGSAAQDPWKWRNICVSLVHSLLTGAGALLAWPPTRGLDAGGCTYCFLADGADMLWNQTLGEAWDLLCHHLVVVSCLSTTILSGHYAGFSVVSLLLELKSFTCLHQKLLLLSHQAPSLAFTVASATLATLALFCLVPLRWMGLWFIQQHHQVPPALVVLEGTRLATAGAVSIMLGDCILVRDALWPWPHSPIPGHQDMGW
ncbi:LOW QUALITY PROTEIN: TLC domain-containing protein 2 [Glossophaga mutica]